MTLHDIWRDGPGLGNIRALAPVLLLLLTPVHSGTTEYWSSFGGDPGGTRYSALDHIDRSNVARLTLAWSYRTGEKARRGDRMSQSAFQNTPILIAGSLIVCSPFDRIIALDPATGAERWVFEPNVALDQEPPLIYKCRGVSAWTDPQAASDDACRIRLLFGTADSRLFAIDAATGTRCGDFGDNGELQVPVSRALAFAGEVQISSPPAVINGVVVVGSNILDNIRAAAPSGRVSAFDARSGESLWTFDPVPRDPDDPAMSTWGPNGTTDIGQANVWSIMSVDEARDLVFLPTTSPSLDFYGGARPGENRYANSVVALRGRTGKVVWHFQIVHHDIWDYDTAAQPVLVNLPHEGSMVPAVVQPTKQGLVFVLHRETGEPLFPVEERPVPQEGAVAGEWLSPTQPVPVRPPPLVAQGLWPEDAWGFTFFDRLACRRKIAALRHGPIYTPPGLTATSIMPAYVGGVNWGSGAFDPVRNLFVVNTNRVPAVVRIIPRDERRTLAAGDRVSVEGSITFPQTGAPYMTEASFLLSPLGAPCTAPPWGGLTAVDLSDGSIEWDVPLGSLETMLPLPIPLEFGMLNFGGPIVTAGGLVFIAATMDSKLRAFDIETGAVLWETSLPAPGQATPMTYRAAGRQYIVIAAGGNATLQTPLSDHVMAFALPD